MGRGSGGSGGRQWEVNARLAQLSEEPVGVYFGLDPLEIIFPQFVVGLATQDDVIGDHEQGVSQGDHSFLGSPPCGNTPVARRQRGMLHVRGGLGCLDKGRAEPDMALAGAATALATGALVVVCGQTLPWGERS